MTYHNDRSTGEVIEGSIFTAAFVTHIHHSLFFPAQQRKAPPLIFLDLGKEKARKLNNRSRAEPWLSFCVNRNGCELWAQRSARPYDRSGSSAFVHSGNCSAENQEKCSACPLTPLTISYLSGWFIGTITHRSPSVNPFSKRNTNWYCQVCGNFILPDSTRWLQTMSPFMPFSIYAIYCTLSAMPAGILSLRYQVRMALISLNNPCGSSADVLFSHKRNERPTLFGLTSRLTLGILFCNRPSQEKAWSSDPYRIWANRRFSRRP